jgi:replicative DNA helicase
VTHPIALAAIHAEPVSALDRAQLVAASDDAAERAVLSAVIFHGALDEALTVVEMRMFYSLAHKSIFRIACDLTKGGQPLDEQTIGSVLQREGTIEKFGGFEYLTGLRTATPDATHVRAHAKTVAMLYQQRRVVETAMSIVTDGLASKSDPSSYVDRALKKITESVERQRGTHLVQMYDTVRARSEAWRKMRETGYVGGLRTGIGAFDQHTDGLPRPGVTMLGAETGAGKSILGWNIGNNVADTPDIRGRAQGVVYVSGEMDDEELHDRAVCARAGVSLRKLRRVMMGASAHPNEQPISADDARTIEDNVLAAMQWLETRPIFTFARVADIHDIRGAVRDANRTLIDNAADPRDPPEVALVVVDFMQMMQVSEADRFDLALTQLGYALRDLAAEKKLAVLALAQKNDRSEKRDGGAFSNRDFKHSSGLAEPAALAGFLDRPVLGMGKRSEDDRMKWRNYSELHFTKGRQVGLGRVQLYFDGPRFHIRDPKAGEFAGLWDDPPTGGKARR